MSLRGSRRTVDDDVRNAAIVRELDRARLRRLWKGVAVGLVLVLVLLFTAWQQLRMARLGYRLQEVQRLRDEEARLREHLLLELDTLRSPALLVVQAERIGLSPPDPKASFVIERVTSSPRPGPSVVAARQEP